MSGNPQLKATASLREDVLRLDEVIRRQWHSTFHDPVGERSDPHVAPLPYPYVVPCARGRFIWFFYWDTYWTNWGLLDHGLVDQARYNIENIAYCISQFGYMPNHIPRGTDRSQPPYFGMMVWEYFERRGSEAWLRWMEPWLRREYEFWVTQRGTPTGLSRYFHSADQSALMRFADVAAKRGVVPAITSEAERLYVAIHRMAEAESGHDFTARFEGRCADFNPVDLNCNLYFYEELLGRIARIVGREDQPVWEARAAQRRKLIQELCWSEERGLFLDYDYVRKKRSDVASLVTFWPLWVGVATAEQAARVMANLPLFEREHGLAACEERIGQPNFQWGYPVMWPPLVAITVIALERCGNRDAARRVAEKYLQTVAMTHRATGQLWEKYDAITGRPPQAEYEAQPMMGWTAGVFTRLVRFCGYV
ncbi:MAG: trehalase family glycosidase [Verrucomicrobiae bacterium]|nr:trehalase family glycosidase [Verrucomicrobiae bacterium]